MNKSPKPPTAGAVTTLMAFAYCALIAAVLQPLWIGLFVTGNLTMLRFHLYTAAAITIASISYLIAAAVFRRKTGNRQPLRAGTWFFAACVIQMAAGTLRILEVHYPMGIIVALSAFAVVNTTRAAGAEHT